jgi:DNA-binding MarR family transcriptional regulator
MKNDASRVTLQQADRLDHKDLGHEARAEGADHAALKLWLRLLATTTQVEDEIRRRLRTRFGISLPRFDYLAQLYRQPDGLKMKDLSRQLMVTGGNVTGLTDRLVAEGLVDKRSDSADGRAVTVQLTPEGRRQFRAMAKAHEAWVVELLGGLSTAQQAQLFDLLGRLKLGVPEA